MQHIPTRNIRSSEGEYTVYVEEVRDRQVVLRGRGFKISFVLLSVRLALRIQPRRWILPRPIAPRLAQMLLGEGFVFLSASAGKRAFSEGQGTFL